MRKIATLATATALALAALAPAAFANNPNCTQKDFASSMQVAAQDKSQKGKAKIAFAYADCSATDDDGGDGGFGGF